MEEIKGYPQKPIFNEAEDAKGNKYKKAYSNIVGDCVVTVRGKNLHFKGRSNLFMRDGKSKFGDELCFYFKIEKLESEYETTSKHECVEFYLPKEFGLEFLENAIKHFKEETK